MHPSREASKRPPLILSISLPHLRAPAPILCRTSASNVEPPSSPSLAMDRAAKLCTACRRTTCCREVIPTCGYCGQRGLRNRYRYDFAPKLLVAESFRHLNRVRWLVIRMICFNHLGTYCSRSKYGRSFSYSSVALASPLGLSSSAAICLQHRTWSTTASWKLPRITQGIRVSTPH